MKKLLSAIVLVLTTLLSPVWACPFCNVDGPATRAFILSVFGFAFLGGACILLWSIGAGHYRDVENPKFRILELDNNTGIRTGSSILTEKDFHEKEEWENE